MKCYFEVIFLLNLGLYTLKKPQNGTSYSRKRGGERFVF